MSRTLTTARRRVARHQNPVCQAEANAGVQSAPRRLLRGRQGPGGLNNPGSFQLLVQLPPVSAIHSTEHLPHSARPKKMRTERTAAGMVRSAQTEVGAVRAADRARLGSARHRSAHASTRGPSAAARGRASGAQRRGTRTGELPPADFGRLVIPRGVACEPFRNGRGTAPRRQRNSRRISIYRLMFVLTPCGCLSYRPGRKKDHALTTRSAAPRTAPPCTAESRRFRKRSNSNVPRHFG